MKNQRIISLVALFLMLFNVATQAEDIDLFVGVPPSSSSIPNVLIIMDNTANWNTPFPAEKDALIALLDDTSGLKPEKDFNLGLMLFTHPGAGKGESGAYVRAALRLMDENNRKKYQALLNSIDVRQDRASGGRAALSMQEAYLYFTGGKPYGGSEKDNADYLGNVFGTPASKAIYALPGNALSSKAATTYNSPVKEGCAKNYIIYISNDAAQDNAQDIKNISIPALEALEGDTTTINLSPAGSKENTMDEWARFMNKKSKLAITTYTIEAQKGSPGQGPGWTALLKSVAAEGGGEYFDATDTTGATTSAKISEALASIFTEIQAENSVFASVSLPINANLQGRFLNQVLIGMFRPDAESKPRWYGNLKQYKLGFKGDNLELLDANNNIATGKKELLDSCARSYWTPTTADTYWSFQPSGSCGTGNVESNTPDGEVVEKGGQAYNLRSATSTRNMKTCSSSACTGLAEFSTSSVTADMLKLPAASTFTNGEAGRTALAEQLIKWQVGSDLQNEDGKELTSVRPSVHGDVIHSRPLAINYNTEDAPEVAVFYGGNDGVLRAVNGNLGANYGSVAPGGEFWSFVPPEFLPKINRIYENTLKVSYPGSPEPTLPSDPPTHVPKDYGVDGLLSAYQDADGTWIYATLRRGGRALYAFEVNNPASPNLKWRVGCLDSDSDCTPGVTGIGQTWSPPVVMKASGYKAGAPMLIMGGGYDTCHDADPNAGCNAASKGRHIYVLDAKTGAVLKTFDTDSSVVGDLVVVPNSTGMAKFAYGADLGGNVYRISGTSPNVEIGNTDPEKWTITKIAAFGGSGADNRKFMFGPDVLDENGTYVLLIGSGDREKPLRQYASASAVQNRFYVFRDKPTVATYLSDEKTNCGAELICHASLTPILDKTTPSDSVLAAKKGWYLALSASEQVVTSAITVFNTVIFSTHVPTPPDPNQCSALGTAYTYNLNYTNAASTRTDSSDRGRPVAGGGLLPSAVVGNVNVDGRTVTVCTSCGAGGGGAGGGDDGDRLKFKVLEAPTGAIRPKSRVYWKIKK